ncbi:hypothetical protein CH256_17615 [Rhodococcus sp. 05-2254-6]|nr:hypothetical protein CH256_17615 [Rhodococcus sp. 05-2254-6]OZF43168.1 hypothetical protein CH291_21715 [Rhodococcus sp. 14-1411-2a]
MSPGAISTTQHPNEPPLVPSTPSLNPITAIGDDRLPVVRPAQPSAGVGRTTTNRPTPLHSVLTSIG